MEKFVVVLAGEYDIARKLELRAEFERLAMVPDLVLDLSDVTYMDSTCISELIRLHRLRAESLFEPETVVVRSSNMQKLFDLLQLRRVFHIVDSVEKAIGKGGTAIVKYALPHNDFMPAPSLAAVPPMQSA